MLIWVVVTNAFYDSGKVSSSMKVCDKSNSILYDENRNDGAHTTGLEARNDSSCVNLSDRVACCGLYSSSYEEDDREAHERESTAKVVVEKRGSNGSKETAGSEQGNNT